MSNRAYYVLALLLLLLAAGLRLWKLPTLPIGFSDNELTQIDLVRDEILRGNIRVFYELDVAEGQSPRGQDGLYHSALALVSLAFGEGTFGLRVFSVFASLISIALMYSLGVRLFGRAGGIASAALMAFMLWLVLLARLTLAETVLPLYITAILLSLARTMPVYQRNRVESSNTVDFATLGTLLGLGLYLHPSSLFVLLLAMMFIAYCMFMRRPFSSRRLSYIGFALLMFIIMAIPYFVSTLRLPEIAANARIFGENSNVFSAITNSILGVVWQGDSSGLYALPQHPLLDPLSAVFVLIGLLVSLKHWREPRFALLFFALIILAPPAVLSSNSPNYLSMVILLPVIILFFGLGFSTILRKLPKNLTWLGGVGMLGLLLGNFAWTSYDFFQVWPQLEAVQIAYNSDIGLIAHHLDLTANKTPTVLCYPNWDVERRRNMPLRRTELVLLHMNYDNAPLRYVDCRRGFLFINAGEYQQVVIANPELYLELPPSVADWIGQGTPIADLPEGSVVEMQVKSALEDILGEFITTTPASFESGDNLSENVPVPPPIRFGGNMTWLGYESDPNPVYTPNSVLPVISYWRVEGLVPSDLVIFTHILSDPVTIAANRDTISVNPTHLEDRDVYLHIAEIQLSEIIPIQDYIVSVGLYQSSSEERLPVFDMENHVRGDRLFIYSITVQEP